MLASVYRHRFLSAAHVHRLHFAGSGERVCQARMRRLWAAHLLDRMYLPAEMPGARDRWSGIALYSLASRGAELVAEALDLDIHRIPHTPAQNRVGYERTRHNLAATDFAVALEVESVKRDWSIDIVREDELRRRLAAASTQRHLHPALVPDGAVTLSGPAWQVPQTIIVEIVRAGAKSGNGSIRRKLHRYRAALRSGFLRTVYGFEWVRAIVWLTPTIRRATTLAGIARDIIGSDRVLRFGAYESALNLALQPYLTPSGALVPLLPELSNT